MFEWHGWHSGDDVTPPEPRKEWLEISDGENELAVIVLRTDAPMLQDTDRLDEVRTERIERAEFIVGALNLEPRIVRELAHKEWEIAKLMGSDDAQSEGWLAFTEALWRAADRYLSI